MVFRFRSYSAKEVFYVTCSTIHAQLSTCDTKRECPTYSIFFIGRWQHLPIVNHSKERLLWSTLKILHNVFTLASEVHVRKLLKPTQRQTSASTQQAEQCCYPPCCLAIAYKCARGTSQPSFSYKISVNARHCGICWEEIPTDTVTHPAPWLLLTTRSRPTRPTRPTCV